MATRGASADQERTAAPATITGATSVGAEGTSQSLARADHAHATNYTATGAGAVARSFAAKLGDVVSVKDFGAVGDGVTDDATAINSALAAAATAGGGSVYLPAGTYIVGATLNMPTTAPVALRGAGINTTTIKLKNTVNVDVVSQANFATLTGGTSTGGVFRIAVSDLTIDGNKANNLTSGFGIRLYGKGFHISNVSIQNARQDGLWTEYAGSDNFSDPTGKLEAVFYNIQTQFNVGNGWTHKGPHDAIVSQFVSYGNGGWGWQVNSPSHAFGVNTYLNTSGGIWVTASGTISGSDVAGTTGTGWGMLIDTSAGGVSISGTFAGPIGIEIKSPNHIISGVVSNTTTAGVKLNGGSANMSLAMFGNTGFWFDVAAQNGASSVVVTSISVTGTLFNGSPVGTWLISGGDTAHKYVGLVQATINAAGWAPVLPQSNATLAISAAVAPAYGASVAIVAYQATLATVTPTDGNAFTIAAPSSPIVSGQRITIRIKNTFGVLGALTFTGGAGGYRLGAAWTQPANGFSRAIDFQYDGTNWIEVSRTPADVPN